MRLGSPTSCKNSVTFSSNLSWPASMHMLWRIVRTRTFLPVPLATASNGGFGLAMRTSPGLSRTGTLRCISILAAADEAMVWLALEAPPTGPPGADSGAGGVAADGIVIFAPHDGHWISEQAPELSTAISCSQ